MSMLSSPRPRLPRNPKQVLFVCTGNSCRSVMAEGLFRKMLGELGMNIEVCSAGTSAFAGIGASLETIRVMRDEGVDVSSHRGRKVTAEILAEADIVFVLHRNHKDYIVDIFPESVQKVFLLSDFYTGDDVQHFAGGIPDPIGMNGQFYRNVMDAIQLSLEGVIDDLRSKQA